jgi:acyl carrier protein
MTIANLKFESNATAREEVLATKDVRTLIAHQLGIDVKRVTDEAHFTDDLGVDWLDRLELMIVIEDQFVDVVITDKDVDQIEVVGDLIRHIENVNNDRRRRSIVEASLSNPQVMATFSSRVVEPLRAGSLGLARRSAMNERSRIWRYPK